VDFADLREPPAEGRIAWYATITRSATDISDLVPVVIPEFDAQLEWGPCRWQSRDATSLPRKGDSALVIFDNRRNPWIAAWWPF
jgi:hypothetical protein